MDEIHSPREPLAARPGPGISRRRWDPASPAAGTAGDPGQL